MTHDVRPQASAPRDPQERPSYPDPSGSRVDPEEKLAPDVDDATAEALGKLSEALETTDRARGHLYTFHQLTGHADFQLDEAVELLRAAGRDDMAELVTRELIGRDVLPGRWTFQIMEEYEDGYYGVFADVERRVRQELAGGRRHIHEARLKRRRQG
ncbi:hypothetical protein GCM10017559_42420 [Streptosporangium longisporum]|uniref:Uncharacterized protein n=1 Tax=Streptosporangium longisporum TaxID=46187 RepID=A0ABP6KMG7_9ACTN